MEMQHNCTLQVSPHLKRCQGTGSFQRHGLLSLGKYGLGNTRAGRDFLGHCTPSGSVLATPAPHLPPASVHRIRACTSSSERCSGPSQSGAVVPAQSGALVLLPGPSSGWGMANCTGMPAGSSAEQVWRKKAGLLPRQSRGSGRWNKCVHARQRPHSSSQPSQG